MAKKKKNRTNNDLQNITQNPKDRATRTPLKAGDELRGSRRVRRFYSTCGTRRVTLVMWKCPDCDYDKRNISVAICDTVTS
jgi:hypothetical protein